MATAITTIVTMNIMRTDRSDVLPSWWVVWLALMAVVFGLPAMTARFIELPGDSARLALLEGRAVSTQDLDWLEKSRKAVVAWFPLNTLYNDLAVVAMERAKLASGTSAAPYFKEAEVWQRRALAASPADPYGWFRLAFLFFMTDGPSARTAAAWTQSVAAAPFEPRLMLARTQLAVKLGGFIPSEARLTMDRLIRETWLVDPHGLTRAAAEGAFVSKVEEALADDPDALQALRKLLEEG